MSLKAKVLRGGKYLAIRQGLGVCLGLIAVPLIATRIGPAAYGIYAASIAVFRFCQAATDWGVRVYLIRKEGEVSDDDYHQAFWLLLLLGIVGAGLGAAALPLLDRWMGLEGFLDVALVLLGGLPLVLLNSVAVAKLERALKFERTAAVEVWCQAVYYVVALALAYAGFGVWAPVIGWWTECSTRVVLYFWAARYVPRLYWNQKTVRAMLGYGVGFAASGWAAELGRLVNPLCVGPLLGAEAVGFVALASRIVRLLNVLQIVVKRVSVAALAKVQRQRERFARAVGQGIELQLLFLGPVLVGFGWVAPWVIGFAFGEDWLAILDVYPYVAVSQLTIAAFALHGHALHVLGKNREVAVYRLVHSLLLGAAAAVAVPALGITGYGWAAVLALPACALMHRFSTRHIGSIDYRLTGIWWLGMCIALFWRELGLWTAGGVLLPLLWPGSIERLKRHVMSLADSVLARRKVAGQGNA